MAVRSGTPDPEKVRKQVREGYAAIARGGSSCCGPLPPGSPKASVSGRPTSKSCCGAVDVDQFAKRLGYTGKDLASLPDGANLGLSCGNPTALASLRPGETVVDLGSGAGFDAFLAARRVGPKGRVIGVDMTAEMLTRARGQIPGFRKSTGLDNVEFRLGEIEHLPVADRSVDVVISNCVLNLSPDKAQVWSEIHRILKPGGRVALSDLALLQPLPPALRNSVAALVGCVAGAITVEETRRLLKESGFVRVALESKPQAIEAMMTGNDPLYQDVLKLLPRGKPMTEFVTSLSITAHRAGRTSVPARRARPKSRSGLVGKSPSPSVRATGQKGR